MAVQSRQLVTDLLGEKELERLAGQLTKAWLDGNMRLVKNTIASIHKITQGIERICKEDVWNSL